MSVSFSSFNLAAIQTTLNEWMDRETRPLTWHKMQLALNKVGLDLARNTVGVEDYAGAAGVLLASAPSTMLVDAGGVAMDLLASADIEQAAVRWSTLLVNTGGETITFKDAAGTTTVGTVATGASKFVAWNGTAWVISPAL